MAVALVNGVEVELDSHEKLNGIQVAARLGIEIPHYCWHPGLSVVASCRMCLVETGTRDPDTGEISMVPKLVPACQTPARDGTVFVTNSDKVRQARAMVEEDLLIHHPIDCPICDKAGECLLQDYHFKHGQGQRRADIRPFTSRRRPMGDTVTLFVDRCVMCSRCVRFTREITGTSELMVVNRGSHEEIDVFPGYPLANRLSGNVVDLCPVGALGDRHFLYRQRVWFMTSHAGICTGCSTGCSIWIDENQDRVYRLKPRTNPHVNQWWMCDDGRYGFDYIHNAERQTRRRVREKDGQHVELEGSELPDRLTRDLKSAGRLAAVLSPHMTVEAAYLLTQFIRQFDPQAMLAMGPVPVVGADETFPNGFCIHAEKCPNRRGVEEVLAHAMGRIVTWDELTEAVASRSFDGVWIAGGYPSPWIDETSARTFDDVGLLIVQDVFDSPLWRRADYQLPGGAFAEQEGSYVNVADRIQSVSWAIRPPAGVETEVRLLWRLLERPGLCRVRDVLHEVAVEIPYFHEAVHEIPPTGLDLKTAMLAASMD